MRVLLVDDEPLLLAILAEIIADWGHLVCTAPDGMAALEVLRSCQFDLMLTDIHMPRLDGAELISRVAVEFPALFVIMMSGFTSEQRRAEIIRSSAKVIGALKKPFDFVELGRMLDHAARLTAAA